MMTDRYRTPLLTARETARHLRMPESTLNYWLSGSGEVAPLVHSIAPERRGWPRVPFIGIVEAHILRSLRALRISKSDIRLAVKLLRHEFDDPYALASQRLATDGVELFMELADKSIVTVRSQQRPIREVIDQYLQYVSWDQEGRPERLQLAQYPNEAAVVIDPRFAWGAPVLAEDKVPVAAVVSLWHAGDSIDDVADEFGLTPRVVEDICRIAA